MYGSHSAALMMRVSTSSRFFGLSLMWVGNPAPPRPTSPEARTAFRKSSRDSTTGGRTLSCTRCSPSESMTRALVVRPPGSSRVVTADTVPDTLACTGADTN